MLKLVKYCCYNQTRKTNVGFEIKQLIAKVSDNKLMKVDNYLPMKSIVIFILNLFCCRSININVSLISQVTNTEWL
jgi:hypothetical protein